MSSGKEIRDYIHENFAEFGVQDLATEPIGFSCPCSREHFKTFLGRLPQDEKEGIMKDDRFPLELECLNCGTKYNFEKTEVRALFGLGKETT